MSNVVSMNAAVPFALFALGLLAAAVSDVRERRIPNVIVAPLIVLGVAYNAHLAGWHGALHALAGFALGIALLFIPFAARMIGGGDVKLLGAIGAWVGADDIISVALRTALLCGVLVAVLLLRHSALRKQVVTNMKNMALFVRVTEVETRPRNQTIAVGAALAAAGVWVAVAERVFAHA